MVNGVNGERNESFISKTAKGAAAGALSSAGAAYAFAKYKTGELMKMAPSKDQFVSLVNEAAEGVKLTAAEARKGTLGEDAKELASKFLTEDNIDKYKAKAGEFFELAKSKISGLCASSALKIGAIGAGIGAGIGAAAYFMNKSKED